MIVIAFGALYLICILLLVAVVWQDRRRAARTTTVPKDGEPRRAHAPTLVFRTHV
ncbi:MAG: hypothetical protein P1P87_12215 [Trueperaceae bacterium]|nr:hypothetical protein [Trueperaceae bacterium]